MNKKIRSLLCLALVMALSVGLAGCGGKSAGNTSDDAQQTEQPLSGEMVYSASFTAIDAPEGVSLNPRAYTADGFYATSYEKIGQRELNEGETLEFEGQLDLYGVKLYYVSNDGKCSLLKNYKAAEAPKDEEGRVSYSSGSDLSDLCVDADGKLLVVESVYANWFDGTSEELNSDSSWDKWRYTTTYYIRRLEPDGTEISTNELDFYVGEDVYLNFGSMVTDKDGNLLVTADMNLLGVAPDGSLAYEIEGSDYLNNAVRLRDGRVGVTSWGNNGLNLMLLDEASHSFGESITLPNNAWELLPGGGDYDLCYRNGSNLYGFKLETGENGKILNWINCDINGDYMNGLNIGEDGTVTGVLSRWRNDTQENEFVTLSLVLIETVPKKETLSLAVMYLNYTMSDMIIDFNRHSDSVRIELRDYSEYNTEDDYSAGQTKLTTEILSGKMPDLLCLDGLPYGQLAGKGLLEDLYPYLDADPGMKREDFFATVLGAMEYNGGLYRISPSFSIQGLIGGASVVGSTPGWTYEQLRAALATMPEGCTILDQYMTRDSVLNYLLCLDMDDFVDWSTGQCSFDSQEFIDLLHFADSFQAEFDWEGYEWSEEESTTTRIAQGRQMLMQAGVYSIDDVLYNDIYFGGDSTYIGWPTNNGVGNMIYLADGAYAMSRTCANKEAGWEFLRTLLTADYQRTLNGLPVLRAVYNEKLEEAMKTEYQKDAEGNYVLDENGERIPVSRGGIGFGDGTVFEIYALSAEQAAKLTALIESTTRVMEQNDSIYNIVQEQAQAFFAGQKSAEEVARLVQSKANIYVNEQR